MLWIPVLLAVAVAAAWWWWPRLPGLISGDDLPVPCKSQSFEGVDYIICEVDLRTLDIAIHDRGADGKAYGSLKNFDDAMAGQGKPVLLAMNAGMYHADLSPVGLLVDNGRELSPVATGDGVGNFFLKPNGIFLIARDGTAAVMETGAYIAAKPDVAFATQSGPMLVIDGALHPRFDPDGKSRNIRNGVGVRDPYTVVLAIARSEVSFGSFARLFKDGLGCTNALYFDGFVSSISNGEEMIIGGDHPVGPIIAVSAKPGRS